MELESPRSKAARTTVPRTTDNVNAGELRRSSCTVRVIHPDDYRPKPGIFDANGSVAPPPWHATREELELATAFEPGALLRLVDPFLCTDGVYYVATARSVTAVFKPAAEIESARPLVPLRSNHLREVGAYRLSRLLGFPEVPPTFAVVEKEHGPGSLRAYVSGRTVEQHRLDSAEVQELQVFDFLIGNQDRHWENVIVSTTGRLVPIDNGLSFPLRDDRDSFRLLGPHPDVPLPRTSPLRAMLLRIQPVRIAALLEQCGIEKEAIEGVLARRRDLVQ